MQRTQAPLLLLPRSPMHQSPRPLVATPALRILLQLVIDLRAFSLLLPI